MSIQGISIRVRAALWRAYEARCFFCQTPIAFAELEVDHLIPGSLRDEDRVLCDLLSRLGLPPNFNLASLDNLVPTHARCNRRKSNLLFSDTSLRYYIELARARLPRVKEEIDRITVQTTNECVLVSVADRIERGLLSRDEVLRVLSVQSTEPPQPVSEPLVIGLSANVAELKRSGDLPKEAPAEYPQLCDWLERDLLSSLRAKGPAVVIPCEASERNGETLGVRVASWAFDLDRLPSIVAPWWELTEVAPYSEVYESPPDSLFLKALVQTANKAVRTSNSSRPLACCPACGSRNLSWSEDSAYHLADDLYYFVKCRDCNWCEEHK